MYMMYAHSFANFHDFCLLRNNKQFSYRRHMSAALLSYGIAVPKMRRFSVGEWPRRSLKVIGNGGIRSATCYFLSVV